MNLLRLLIFITAAPVYTKHAVTGEAESPIDIYKSVTIERVYLKTTHEEADNILAHQTVATAQKKQKEFRLFQMILMYSFYCFIIIKPKTSQYQLSLNLSSKRESCHRHTTDSAEEQ